MSHEGLHEPAELLTDGTRNLHRALISLIEELEAIDWYQQRADACTDPALKAVLLHNRNEEVEHGMMTLEWLRRNDATFNKFSFVSSATALFVAALFGPERRRAAGWPLARSAACAAIL